MAAEALGVVVLAYGSGGEYEPLLASLLEQGVPPTSILIVHNPATQGEPAPRTPAGCEVLRAERNLGYAGGMNLGLARLRERGVALALLLTHDARLRPGALRALLDAARERPGYGVLAPVLELAGTNTPFSFGGITDAHGLVSHLKAPPVESDDGVAPCDWADGGTLLIRAALLDRVGTFDERFWSYCEEADLCLRVRRAGFLVGIVLDAIADQDPGSAKRPGAWSYLLARNGIAYARRAAGSRGMLARTGLAARQAAISLARALARGLGLRKGSPREHWAVTVGTMRGIFDYFRGRWGPPPPGLPGMGDVRNA